jgi:DeoR/GlpR family transcriptional regulator of sugar metabolism
VWEVTATRDRRSRIVDLVEQEDEVRVSALAARFGLTDTAIRRDLVLLEDQGLLKRVRGGAVARATGVRIGAYATKLRERAREKARIGAVAAAMVKFGDVAIFDSGTTVAHVAGHIPRPLRIANAITVVTNSLPVIEEVETWDNPHLIDLGGLYLADYRAFVGPQALANLRGLSADIAFLGCDGLTVEGGLTTPHMLVAEVGSATAARARCVVVVADASKLDRRGFTPIIPLAMVNVLITDTSAEPNRVAEIRAAGVDVRLA